MFTGRRSRHHIYLRSREIIGRGTTIECLCRTMMLTEHYPDNDRDYTTHYIYYKDTRKQYNTSPVIQ